jgi:hypothetical protein
MRITLYAHEKRLLREYAKDYLEKTSDEYSIFHICAILKDLYEQRLEKDLETVMDIKLREFQEEHNK